MITNINIDNGKGFDWGRASLDYAKYRDIYPQEFYERIINLGLCKQGQSVLDLGTGTGVLPRNMYKYGAKFTAADISENQIRYAKELSSDMDIEYIVSSAENLDFEEDSFDVVTACQCFMYFDKEIILPKIKKWLKPNGHFLILFMGWLPDESEIADMSEKLVLKYNPYWTGGGMKKYNLKAPDWSEGLFEVANAITYDIDVPFNRDTWNGRMKACRGIAASLPPEKVSEFEKEHMEYLKSVANAFVIPHYASILDLKVR